MRFYISWDSGATLATYHTCLAVFRKEEVLRKCSGRKEREKRGGQASKVEGIKQR